MNKKEIIIANKMDIEGSKENLEVFKTKVDKKIFEISAANNIGLDRVIDELETLVKNTKEEDLYDYWIENFGDNLKIIAK